MSAWAWAWIAWAASFVVLEGLAVANKRNGDTLSANIRALFHVYTHTGRAVFLVAFGVFAAWFVVHIAG